MPMARKARLWRIFVFVVSICQTCLCSGPISASERPRDITIFLYSPHSESHTNGQVLSNTWGIGVYFGRDGTAFVSFGPDEGVVLEPNADSGSHTAFLTNRPPVVDTATLSGTPNELHLTFGINTCNSDMCVYAQFWYVVNVAGASCVLLGGNSKHWLTTPVYPTVSENYGPQTCILRPGRDPTFGK
jgi:hypothetical protein